MWIELLQGPSIQACNKIMSRYVAGEAYYVNLRTIIYLHCGCVSHALLLLLLPEGCFKWAQAYAEAMAIYLESG